MATCEKPLYGTAQWESQGRALSQHALQAAKRQTDNASYVIIANEIAQAAIDHGDIKTAEQIWSDLLTTVATRPSTKTSQDGVESSANTPPLTSSQFRDVMDIALLAANNQLPHLSQRALRESLKGGLPISDVGEEADASNSLSSLSSTFAVSSSNPFGNSSYEEDQSETDVADKIFNVVKAWDIDTYNKAETVSLLKSFVIPENRQQEILLYANNATLNSRNPESLGKLLLQWANAAGQIDEVMQQASTRGNYPSARIPYHVLCVLHAIEQKNTDKARSALQSLAAAIDTDKSSTSLNLALHAAIPAIEFPELQDDAFEIVGSALLSRIEESMALNDPTLNNSDYVSKAYSDYLFGIRS